MPFVAIKRAELPAKKGGAGRKSDYNAEDAAQLLALASGDGASDGVEYATNKAALNALAKARRLVRHVLPDGKTVASRTYQNPTADGAAATFGWALWLADAKPQSTETGANGAAGSKSKAKPAKA